MARTVVPKDEIKRAMEDLGPLCPQGSDTYIYFVQAEQGGPIKIGQSVDPSKRIRELQVGNPYKLCARRIVKTCPIDEYQLHDLFREYRLSGEWFRAHPVLANLCDAIPDPELAGEALSAPADCAGMWASILRWDDPEFVKQELHRRDMAAWRKSPDFVPDLPAIRVVRG